MRSSSLAAASAVVALLSAGSAFAAPQAELDVHTLASASLSINGVTDAQTLQTSNKNATLFSHVHDNPVSGLSFANGTASASFSVLHAIADAFDSVQELPDAQSTAEASWADYGVGTGVSTIMSTFITGSASPQPQFGPGPSALVTWRVDDLTSLNTLLLGSWSLSNPVMMFNPTYLVPLGDQYRVFLDLSVFAYDGAQSQPGTVFSDFSHTVRTFLDSADGAPVILQSGHDYSTPAAAGVPEPAAWALTLLGFGGLGVAARRRRAGLAAA